MRIFIFLPNQRSLSAILFFHTFPDLQPTMTMKEVMAAEVVNHKLTGRDLDTGLFHISVSDLLHMTIIHEWGI